MPHHYWAIGPDNPGPVEYAAKIAENARAAGGEVLSIGRTHKHTWFVLVDIRDDEKEDAVYEAVGGRAKLFKVKVFYPPENEPQSAD